VIEKAGDPAIGLAVFARRADTVAAKTNLSTQKPLMSLNELSWLALAAYAVHILDEFVFDWRNRAGAVVGLPVEWSDC
jgi:hypothetical protein